MSGHRRFGYFSTRHFLLQFLTRSWPRWDQPCAKVRYFSVLPPSSGGSSWWEHSSENTRTRGQGHSQLAGRLATGRVTKGRVTTLMIHQLERQAIDARQPEVVVPSAEHQRRGQFVSARTRFRKRSPALFLAQSGSTSSTSGEGFAGNIACPLHMH